VVAAAAGSLARTLAGAGAEETELSSAEVATGAAAAVALGALGCGSSDNQ
jgi:hypothetical protein